VAVTGFFWQKQVYAGEKRTNHEIIAGCQVARESV